MYEPVCKENEDSVKIFKNFLNTNTNVENTGKQLKKKKNNNKKKLEKEKCL